MLQLQKSLKDLIQTELNKNTQGLDFEVSLYNVKNNNLLENTFPVGDTYATEQKRFVPVIIDSIDGEYADLRNLTALESVISLSFLVPTDSQDFNNMVIDETFEKVSEALDEFRLRALASNLPLGNQSYVLSTDYSLRILNYNNTFSADYVEFEVTFLDDSDGIIIEDKNIYKIEKIGSNLKFTYQAQEFSVPIVLDKKYRISTLYQPDFDLLSVFVDKSYQEVPTHDFTNVTSYDIRDLFFGGLNMSANKLIVGGYDGNTGVSNNVYIEDFSTAELIDGNEADIQKINLGSYLTGENGTAVLGFSVPNPTTNQFTFGNGLNYQQFELSLTAFVTDTVFVGNDVKYFLDGIEIFPFYRDEAFTSETDASQVVGQEITKHTAVQSIIGKEYSIYLKPNSKLIELAQKITSETPTPNQVYTLKIQYPLFEREYKVIVTQGALGITNNQPISISVKFDLASNILL